MALVHHGTRLERILNPHIPVVLAVVQNPHILVVLAVVQIVKVGDIQIRTGRDLIPAQRGAKFITFSSKKFSLFY